MKTQSTTEKLIKLLEKESKKFKNQGILKNSYEKFSKINIDTKSTYSLPLKDTLGKTLSEQFLNKSIETNNETIIRYM